MLHLNLIKSLCKIFLTLINIKKANYQKWGGGFLWLSPVGSWRLKYSTAGGQVLGCFCRDLGALTGSNLILPEGEDE